MGNYSIKELERLSGIKAHTLRIWEKRYDIITPSRTTTNIRYYNDEDLKKIINISILKKNGFKIGAIASLSIKELSVKIEELHKLKSSPQSYEDQLLLAMLELDESRFEKIIGKLIMKHGFEYAFEKILFSFMERVGVMWLTSNISPAHEHFLSNLIRQKIIVAIDSLPLVEDKQAPKAILFLPEQELHEIGLLYYHYHLRKNNCRTMFLGQIVPILDLLDIAKNYQPSALVTSFSTDPQQYSIGEIVTQLSMNIPNCTTYITGFQFQSYKEKLPENVKIFRSVEELKDIYS